MVNLIQRNGFYVRHSIPAYSREEKMNKLIYQVSSASGISIHDLKSASRVREITEWRHIICYIARKKGYGSFREIGLSLGGRDHSSILFACGKVSDLLECGDVDMVGRYKMVENL